MDNLSHSLVGLAVGELLHRCLPQETTAENALTRRRLLLIAGALASNFPDLDLLLTPLLQNPLGYLLHHRGHTHTLLFLIPQAFLLCTMLWLAWPSARRLLRASPSTRTGLCLTILVGLLLHLAMDALNSYGIHPFHPFDSSWYYTDLVFVVEPLFWVVFGIPLAVMVARRAFRIALLVMLVALVLLVTSAGFLTWEAFAVLMGLALILGALARRSGPRESQGLLASFGAILSFIGIKAYTAAIASDSVRAELRSQNPSARILDTALTAFPSHPLCWAFVSIETDASANIYTLKRGVLSLAPSLVPVAACAVRFSEGYILGSETSGIAWISQAHARVDALRQLQRENCHFDAWLRFARAPLLEANAASDLRYATALRGNFSTFNRQLFADRACPRWVPGWDYPRADLLKPGSSNAAPGGEPAAHRLAP